MDRELRSDAEIESAVQAALEWARGGTLTEIIFAVSNGQVTLEGRVSGWDQRAHIERAVRILADVSCLFNRMQVCTAMTQPSCVCEVIGRATNVRGFDGPEAIDAPARPGPRSL